MDAGVIKSAGADIKKYFNIDGPMMRFHRRRAVIKLSCAPGLSQIAPGVISGALNWKDCRGRRRESRAIKKRSYSLVAK